MSKWAFVVPGKPVPYQRTIPVTKDRYGRYLRKLRGVKPEPMRVFQAKVQTCARLAGVRMVASGPVQLFVISYLKRLPDAANSGDWDNYGKAISDALNGIAYTDDCQVVVGLTMKVKDSSPRTEVLIRQGNDPLIIGAEGLYVPTSVVQGVSDGPR